MIDDVLREILEEVKKTNALLLATFEQNKHECTFATCVPKCCKNKPCEHKNSKEIGSTNVSECQDCRVLYYLG